MVESAPLLREYGLIAHRGFESLALRHSSESLLNKAFKDSYSKNVVQM